jgi:1-acyl-sn-glycerol-3-phosphate acyltransferase
MSDRNTFNRAFDGWSLDGRDPRFIESLMPIWEWLYHYYFRVTSDGWHHIPSQEPMLIVGSHNGGLLSPDMFMGMYDWFHRFGTERKIYGLAHPNIWKATPSLAEPAVKCGAVQASAEMAIKAFSQEASVLVYPGGLQDVFRPYSMRHQIYFAGRKGFVKLALYKEVPIIPIISKGAHETLIVLADLYEQIRQLHDAGLPWPLGIDPEVFPIYLGLPWGIGIGPIPNIPLPLQIHIRVCEPIKFDRYGQEAADDSTYVDACFKTVRTQMQQELDRLVRGT